MGKHSEGIVQVRTSHHKKDTPTSAQGYSPFHPFSTPEGSSYLGKRIVENVGRGTLRRLGSRSAGWRRACRRILLDQKLCECEMNGLGECIGE